jgi:hypothetical protein
MPLPCSYWFAWKKDSIDLLWCWTNLLFYLNSYFSLLYGDMDFCFIIFLGLTGFHPSIFPFLPCSFYCAWLPNPVIYNLNHSHFSRLSPRDESINCHLILFLGRVAPMDFYFYPVHFKLSINFNLRSGCTHGFFNFYPFVLHSVMFIKIFSKGTFS